MCVYVWVCAHSRACTIIYPCVCAWTYIQYICVCVSVFEGHVHLCKEWELTESVMACCGLNQWDAAPHTVTPLPLCTSCHAHLWNTVYWLARSIASTRHLPKRAFWWVYGAWLQTQFHHLLHVFVVVHHSLLCLVFRGGGMLLQVLVTHEMQSQRSGLNNRSVSLKAYQTPKHEVGFYSW